MSSTRTVTTGTGLDWRFTAGEPDGLNVPSTGPVAGLPPCVWITGGGLEANSNPSTTGFDRILDALCEVGGYSFAQVNAPWFLGNDNVQDRIDDAVAWLRDPANGINASMDAPILLGFSNGAICSLRYARDNTITAVVLCLPPVDNDLVYTTNYGGGREVFEHGDPAKPGGGWGITYPGTPHLPDRGSPWGHEDEYEGLGGKICVFYSASDYIFAPQDMGFYTLIRAEMHNLGPIGHIGTWSTSWLGETGPADQIDTDRLVAFVDERVAAL